MRDGTSISCNRRRVLSVVGGVGVVGLSGCVSRIPGVGSGGERGRVSEAVSVLEHDFVVAESVSGRPNGFVVGEAVNTVSDVLPSVVIEAVFFDSSGDVLTGGADSFTDVGGGASFEFEVPCLVPDGGSWSMDDVESYEVEVVRSLEGREVSVPGDVLPSE